MGSDGGNIQPLDFGIPLTQVGILSTNEVGMKRSSYSIIAASYGIGFEANTYSSARSSYSGLSGYGVYLSNYCTVDSTAIGNNHAHQASSYSSIMASDGAQIVGSSRCFTAAVNKSPSGPSLNIGNQSAIIATSDPTLQWFNNSAIIGGSSNILDGGVGPLDSSLILAGKNWTVQESDTIAIGAASGASTRLLVSASGGMYLGGDLQVTGSTLVNGKVEASLGLSGSLTTLANGQSYLIAGDGIIISSGSNTSVTISQKEWMTVTLGHAAINAPELNTNYYVGQMYGLPASTTVPSTTGSFQYTAQVTGSIRKVDVFLYSANNTGQKAGPITIKNLTTSQDRTLFGNEVVDMTSIYETKAAVILTSSLDISPNDRVTIEFNAGSTKWTNSNLHATYDLLIQVSGSAWP
jgi:hypothetical protein